MNRIGNGMCDAVCLSSDCNFDGGDCECYLTGCEWYKVKDGVCNESCNNEVCKFDGGDCLQ